MLEELRRHREMVQSRIKKSFESDGLRIDSLNDEIFKAKEIEDNTSVNNLIKAGVLEFDETIEKAVYADTAENRKLGRVGQEYHRGKGKKEDEKSKVSRKKSNNEKDNNKKVNSDSKDEAFSSAVNFLEKNADKYMDYQYGDLEDEELEKLFDEASKFIKNFKTFDWSEENEATEYKQKMESKGYKVIDLGEGSDTYVFAVMKNKK